MGMRANYQEIKKEDFEKLLESDDFFENFRKIEEKEEIEFCDIDKTWDALHFLINGVSAICPIENNPLSEFIVGSFNFDDESEELVRYISTEKVIEISKKLNELNFQDYLKDFDMTEFGENGIYPNIWDYDDEKEIIMEELNECFENLKEFYNKVANNKNIVVVTIC